MHPDGSTVDAPRRDQPRLIAELQADARLSLAELGRRVGLSSPAVAERLRRLEDAGVITGYRAEVDPRRARLRVRRRHPDPAGARQLRTIAELARSTPEVVECHRVTGDDCFIMIAYVRDVEHLEQVIDRFAVHGQTTSSIMQSSPVPRRPVEPPVRNGFYKPDIRKTDSGFSAYLEPGTRLTGNRSRPAPGGRVDDAERNAHALDRSRSRAGNGRGAFGTTGQPDAVRGVAPPAPRATTAMRQQRGGQGLREPPRVVHREPRPDRRARPLLRAGQRLGFFMTPSPWCCRSRSSSRARPLADAASGADPRGIALALRFSTRIHSPCRRAPSVRPASSTTCAAAIRASGRRRSRSTATSSIAISGPASTCGCASSRAS